MPFYRTLFRDALLITWKHKILWLFGLFSSLTVLGQTGQLDALFSASDRLTSIAQITSTLSGALRSGRLGAFLINILHSSQALMTAGLLLVIATGIAWLMVVSQGAILSSIEKIARKEKFTFEDSLKVGRTHFWPLFAITILVQVFTVTLLILVGLPYMGTTFGERVGIDVIFALLFFMIYIPGSIIVSLVGTYAYLGVIMNKKARVGESIADAVRTFKNNWLVSLEMAILLLAAAVAAGLLLVVGLTLIIALFELFSFVGDKMFGNPGFITARTLEILSVTALLFLFVSVLSTFNASVWTLLWLSIRKGSVTAKIVRMSQRMQPRPR